MSFTFVFQKGICIYTYIQIHTLERYAHNPYIICIYIFKMCRYIFQPPVFMGLPGPKSWFSWKLWDVLFVDFKMGHKENNHKIVTLIHRYCNIYELFIPNTLKIVTSGYIYLSFTTTLTHYISYLMHRIPMAVCRLVCRRSSPPKPV